VNLLRADSADLVYMFDVFKKSMQSYIVAVRGPWDEEEQYFRFIEELDIDNCQIIEVNGCRVGFIDKRNIGSALLIHMLALAPAHQRRGIGSRVLKTVIDESKEFGLPIVLGVLKSNAEGKRFYESYGFTTVHEGKIHYQLSRECGS
jgi:ribosomal protein S18 acetylase RimI-like enzyme